MFLAHPRQIWWWCEDAQPTIVLKCEMRFEGSIEFARSVVPSPNRVVIHAYGYRVAGKPYSRPRPVPASQVMRNLPRAKPPDHREHERAPGPEQASAFARDIGKVGHAIERPKIGVRAIVDALSVHAVQLVGTHRKCAHTIRHVLALGAVAGPP